jgi:hypothetical protein
VRIRKLEVCATECFVNAYFSSHSLAAACCFSASPVKVANPSA